MAYHRRTMPYLPRLAAIVLALLLLPSATGEAWSMFGHDAAHTGAAEPTPRTIGPNDPVVSWDMGNTVSSEEIFSWGSAVGNFSANVDDEYDRNVLHVVYITTFDNSGDLHGRLVIRDGGHPGKLMWQRDLGEVRDENNVTTDIQNEFADFEAAYGAPALGDFNGNGRLDVAVTTPDGRVEFFEPRITYNAETGNYGGGSAVWSSGHWTHETYLTIARSSPAVADLDGGDDLVVTGVDRSEGRAAVVAIDGNGSRLWRYETPGTEISSPVVLREGPNRKIFISLFDSSNLEVWGLQNGAALSGWNPKTIGQVAAPSEGALHPLLPSLVLADLTDDEGTELLVPQPAPDADGDAKLWLFRSNSDPATGWSSAYTLSESGDMDATPAVGDIDGDDALDIVAVTWLDPGSGNNEVTHVWAVGGDQTLAWHVNYDTASSGGWDDDEHAIASPILATIDPEDGSDNLDVLTATTPRLYALDGNDGSEIWYATLENRDNDNRIFNSPAAADLDGNTLLDVFIDGAVYSANLADLVVRRGDITVMDEHEDEVTEGEEGGNFTIHITIHNEGNHEATNVEIDVRLDDPESGPQLANEILNIDANSVQNLAPIDWTPGTPGDLRIWVRCVIDVQDNEEVRYDNNNASAPFRVWPAYDVTLSPAGNTSAATDPGAPVNFSLTLTNPALNRDNYTLGLTGLPAGWNASFPTTVNEVASNASAGVELTVTPDADATAGNHTVTLIATSEGNTSRSDAVELTVNVNQTYGVTLDLPVGSQRVLPDTWVGYAVLITNTGNGDDTFELSSGIDWSAEIRVGGAPAGTVMLGPNETAEAELRLRPPGSADWNDQREVDFTALSQNDGSATDTVATNTSVGLAMVLDAFAGVLPRETALFELRVRNLHDASDNLTLEVIDSPGWDYTLEPWRFAGLAGDEGGTLWFNVTVPEEANAGTRETLTLAVSGDESGFSDELELVIEVLAPTGLRLWPNEGVLPHRFVDPGDSVYFDLRVVNFDNSAQEVTLNHDTLPNGWSVLYENASSWSRIINSQQQRTVSVRVNSDAGAEAVSTVPIVIIADADTLPPARYHGNVTINQAFGVELELPDKQMLLGNVSTAVRLTLHNRGNGPDTFEVNITGAWATEELRSYSLDGFESRQFSIMVEPGLLAPGTTASFDVVVHSTKAAEGGLDVRDSGTVPLEITGLLSTSGTVLSAPPGENTTLQLVAEGLADTDTNVTRLILELNGGAADWSGFAAPDYEPYESHDHTLNHCLEGVPRLVELIVQVPTDMPAGNYTLLVVLEDYNEPGHRSELDLIVVVEQVHNLSLTLDSTPSPVNPGAAAEYQFTIINHGNGNDTLDLAVEGLPPGWLGAFDPSTVAVPRDETRSATLTVTPHGDALAGQYAFTASGTGPGTALTQSLNLTVATVYGLTLELTSPADFTGTVGHDNYYTFRITNTGNRETNFTVSATGAPAGYEIQSTAVQLAPGAVDTNHLRVVIPLTGGPTWTITLTVWADDEPEVRESATLTLEREALIDMSLSDMRYTPSPPVVGEKVTVSVRVSASGGDAQGVWVEFRLGSRLLGREPVSVEDGGSQIVTTSFTAEAGDFNLEARLEIPDTFIDSNTANNVVTTSFSVEEEDSLLGALLVMLALAAVVIGGVYYWRKQRGETPLAGEKPTHVEIETGSADFPLLVNCGKCGARIRVAKPGSFRCPSCKHVDRVDVQGEVGGSATVSPPQTEKTAAPEPAEFPLIIHCPACDAKVRVRKAGSFRCPGCKNKDEIDEFGKITGAEPEPEPTPITEPAPAPQAAAPEPEPETKTTPAPKPEAVKNAPAEFPLIIRCPDCDAKVRVRQPGGFRCPGCKHQDQVNESGVVAGATPKLKTAPEPEPVSKPKPETAPTPPDEVEKPAAPEPPAPVEFPLIIHCPSCDAKVRVHKIGGFRCPACKHRDKVDAQGRVVSKIPAIDFDMEMDFDPVVEEQPAEAPPASEAPDDAGETAPDTAPETAESDVPEAEIPEADIPEAEIAEADIAEPVEPGLVEIAEMLALDEEQVAALEAAGLTTLSALQEAGRKDFERVGFPPGDARRLRMELHVTDFDLPDRPVAYEPVFGKQRDRVEASPAAPRRPPPSAIESVPEVQPAEQPRPPPETTDDEPVPGVEDSVGDVMGHSQSPLGAMEMMSLEFDDEHEPAEQPRSPQRRKGQGKAGAKSKGKSKPKSKAKPKRKTRQKPPEGGSFGPLIGGF